MDPTAPSDDDIWLLPVTIVARDRVWLRADLALVDGAVGTAVLCHPHPQYGGDRFNVVIDALFRALPEAGITTVRFDFRSGAGIGDDLELPRRDATGAVDESINQHPDLPTFVIGYSFGAAVVLGLHDIRVAATVAIAPPLAVLQEEVAPVRPDARPRARARSVRAARRGPTPRRNLAGGDDGRDRLGRPLPRRSRCGGRRPHDHVAAGAHRPLIGPDLPDPATHVGPARRTRMCESVRP